MKTQTKTVKLSLTITLDGETAELWKQFAEASKALAPSNAQLAIALIAQGLRTWKEQE